MANFPKPKTEVQSYVLESQRQLPTDEQTTWKLKSLSVRDSTRLDDSKIDAKHDEKSGDTVLNIKTGTSFFNAVLRGLVGWENLQVGEVTVEFVGGSTEQDGLKRITPEEVEKVFGGAKWAIAELGKEIIKISSLSEAEKNS